VCKRKVRIASIRSKVMRSRSSGVSSRRRWTRRFDASGEVSSKSVRRMNSFYSRLWAQREVKDSSTGKINWLLKAAK
jgi:hypothetical protein